LVEFVKKREKEPERRSPRASVKEQTTKLMAKEKDKIIAKHQKLVRDREKLEKRKEYFQTMETN